MSIALNRITILFFAFFLFSGFGQEASGDNFLNESKINLDVTYASKYIGRRGVDYFGNGSAIHPNLSIDLGKTGLYIGTWAAIPIQKGCKDPFGDLCSKWVEYDTYAGYGKALWKDEIFATTFDLSYAYLYYPRQVSQDQQSIGIKFSHPNLLPVIGASRPYPFWGSYYTWRTNNIGRNYRDFLLGIGYDIPVLSHTASTFVDVVYSDGVGGSINSRGITRIRTGVSTSYKLNGITFTPALTYQSARKETNPAAWLESEFWFTLKVSLLQ